MTTTTDTAIDTILHRAAAADVNSIATLRALLLIYRAGSAGMSEIAVHTGKSTAAITGTVDRLERERILARVRPPHDRRAIRVELTPLGRAFVHELLAA